MNLLNQYSSIKFKLDKIHAINHVKIKIDRFYVLRINLQDSNPSLNITKEWDKEIISVYTEHDDHVDLTSLKMQRTLPFFRRIYLKDWFLIDRDVYKLNIYKGYMMRPLKQHFTQLQDSRNPILHVSVDRGKVIETLVCTLGTSDGDAFVYFEEVTSLEGGPVIKSKLQQYGNNWFLVKC